MSFADRFQTGGRQQVAGSLHPRPAPSCRSRNDPSGCHFFHGRLPTSSTLLLDRTRRMSSRVIRRLLDPEGSDLLKRNQPDFVVHFRSDVAALLCLPAFQSTTPTGLTACCPISSRRRSVQLGQPACRSTPVAISLRCSHHRSPARRSTPCKPRTQSNRPSGRHSNARVTISDLSDADLLVRPSRGQPHRLAGLGHLIESEPGLIHAECPTPPTPCCRPDSPNSTRKERPRSDTGFVPRRNTWNGREMRRRRRRRWTSSATPTWTGRVTGRMAHSHRGWSDLFLMVANHTMMHAGQFTVVRAEARQAGFVFEAIFASCGGRWGCAIAAGATSPATSVRTTRQRVVQHRHHLALRQRLRRNQYRRPERRRYLVTCLATSSTSIERDDLLACWAMHPECLVKRRSTGPRSLEGAQTMEYRQLGGSGFKVPALSLGTGTFGGGNEFFKAWGASDVAEATRLVDICLDAGLDHVRLGRHLLAAAWPRRSSGRRSRAAATRCSSPPRAPSASGQGPNDVGSSRYHLIARGRGEPAAARHRLHRPLSAARLRRADAGRGGAAARSTTWCAPARSATSAARTSPAGT